MSMAEREKAEMALMEQAMERTPGWPEGVRLKLGPEEETPAERSALGQRVVRALETYAAHLEAMAMKEMHDRAKEAQA